ncbi:MAG: helix-turn-helix domain-containing protein, partial [Eubacteriales bacterium]
MSFGNNVLYYRKKCNITQEELAEKLDVTRQTVSRWETDSAFPDMEKLLELCKIFDCNMDVLVRGDAQAEGEKSDTKALEEYDGHMNMFTKFITAGVGLVLLGLSCMFLVNAIFSNEVAGLIVFLSFVTVSVSLFISSGISHGNFISEHPHIEEYPKEQKKSFMRKMPFLISGATALVLIGVIILIALTYREGYAPSGMTRENWEYVVTSVFFVFIAVAA